MSDFTVRVEIQGSGPADYDALDRVMIQDGFRREIAGTDNSGNRGIWALPVGEYDFSAEGLSAQDVREKVQQIATGAALRVWILVTEVKTRSWSTRKLRST